jgi:hypothetical protein
LRRRRVRRGAGGAWSLYRSLRRTGTINPEQHGIGSAIDIRLCYEQGKGREGKVPRHGSHLSAVEGRAPDVGQRRGKMGARWRAWLLGCANGPGRRPGGGNGKSQGGLGWLGLSASRPPGRVRLIFLFFFFFILFPKPFQKRF